MKDIVFFDTEYTSWEGAQAEGWSRPGQFKELVQIGAVKIDRSSFVQKSAFSVLALPVRNPVLSDYFVHLTGITNAQLAAEGLAFTAALDAFKKFAGDAILSSYGNDDAIIRLNLGYHNLPDEPAAFTGFNILPWIQQHGAAHGIAKTHMSGDLSTALGLAVDASRIHNAMFDAGSIADSYRFLRQRGAPEPDFIY